MKHTLRIVTVLAFVLILSGCFTKEKAIPANVSIQPQQPSRMEETQTDRDAPDVLIGVNHVKENSSDGKLRAETYGVNTGVTSGGLYPAEGIRIVDIASGKTLWHMTGYYDAKFLWSGDGQYLAVSYRARIYGETVVVDAKDFSQKAVPIPEDISVGYRKYRPDPYVEASEWTDDDNLQITCKWTGTDDMLYSGTFVYRMSSGEIKNVVINEAESPG